jgi:hypothetical protein
MTIACALELRERQILSLKELEVASSTPTFIKRMRQAGSVHLKSLWVLGVLCASVVSSFQRDFTTETEVTEAAQRRPSNWDAIRQTSELPRYPVKKKLESSHKANRSGLYSCRLPLSKKERHPETYSTRSVCSLRRRANIPHLGHEVSSQPCDGLYRLLR